jgi:hypothetical protein
MQFDYSLEAMLPFARAAIRGHDKFSHEEFAEYLFGELEKAGVPGVVKQLPKGRLNYNYSELHCSPKLRFAEIEVFWHLVHRGFVLPQPQGFPTAFSDLMYWKTPRGGAWAAGAEALPEDVAGYMRHLSSIVPSLDSVIRQYVQEGLMSFERGAYFSAAVMLGAASEKEIYLLGGSLLGALKDASAQAQLTKLVDGRALYRLLESIAMHVATCKNPRAVFDGADLHLMSLFDSIRVQRNDAVHPKTANVNEASVRFSYDAFPGALQKAEALRAWFDGNPGSV